jgi:hypothetical protein
LFTAAFFTSFGVDVTLVFFACVFTKLKTQIEVVVHQERSSSYVDVRTAVLSRRWSLKPVSSQKLRVECSGLPSTGNMSRKARPAGAAPINTRNRTSPTTPAKTALVGMRHRYHTERFSMTIRRRCLLTCIGVPVLLPAADPWKNKKAAEWNVKDATRILTNSPWAKTVAAEIAVSQSGRGPGGGGMSGPPPGGGMGGPSGRGMGGPGGMGAPVGGMDPPTFVIRWESAGPVRQAAAKIEDPNGTKIAELSRDFYVISTSGGFMPDGRRGGAGGEGQRPQPDVSRLEEGIPQATSLCLKGHEAIAPGKFEVLQNGRGMTTLFLFPRSYELTAAAKEVTFETTMLRLRLRTKFSLKKMIYEGRPAF